MRMTVKPFRYKNFQKSFHIYNYIDALEFLHLPYEKPSPFRRKSLRMRNLPVCLPPPSETTVSAAGFRPFLSNMLNSNIWDCGAGFPGPPEMICCLPCQENFFHRGRLGMFQAFSPSILQEYPQQAMWAGLWTTGLKQAGTRHAPLHLCAFHLFQINRKTIFIAKTGRRRRKRKKLES